MFHPTPCANYLSPGFLHSPQITAVGHGAGQAASQPEPTTWILVSKETKHRIGVRITATSEKCAVGKKALQCKELFSGSAFQRYLQYDGNDTARRGLPRAAPGAEQRHVSSMPLVSQWPKERVSPLEAETQSPGRALRYQQVTRRVYVTHEDSETTDLCRKARLDRRRLQAISWKCLLYSPECVESQGCSFPYCLSNLFQSIQDIHQTENSSTVARLAHHSIVRIFLLGYTKYLFLPYYMPRAHNELFHTYSKQVCICQGMFKIFLSKSCFWVPDNSCRFKYFLILMRT